MKLKDYIYEKRLSVDESAAKLGISRTHLYEIIAERAQAGPTLAIYIEAWSNGEVSRGDLRPDLWPE